MVKTYPFDHTYIIIDTYNFIEHKEYKLPHNINFTYNLNIMQLNVIIYIAQIIANDTFQRNKHELHFYSLYLRGIKFCQEI